MWRAWRAYYQGSTRFEATPATSRNQCTADPLLLAVTTTGSGFHVFGVLLIGAHQQNLHKLVLTAGVILIAFLLTKLLRAILRLFIGTRAGTRFQFWARQGASLILAAIVVIGILSIWFDSPARLGSFLGLIGAGVAFALQRAITAVAGYFVILRGKTFNVGDRIVMGGVRGDVIDLSFMQTQIMEMGESPNEQADAPAMWVKSRQYTGRIVTVTNDKVFDCPVYNYTHDFPYIWDEISLPIHYRQDYVAAERIMLAAARRQALSREQLGDEEVHRIKDRFGIDVGDVAPAVFWRATENWLQLTVRFLGPDHGLRGIKDRMTREIVTKFEADGIVVAAVRQEGLAPPK